MWQMHPSISAKSLLVIIPMISFSYSFRKNLMPDFQARLDRLRFVAFVKTSNHPIMTLTQTGKDLCRDFFRLLSKSGQLIVDIDIDTNHSTAANYSVQTGRL